MTTTIVARTWDSAEELHAAGRVSGYTHSENPSPARLRALPSNPEFRPRNLSETRAAISEPFSSSSLPPSLAPRRSAAAFTNRARVDDAGPSFSDAAAAHADSVLGLLRERGHPRAPGGQTGKRIAVVGGGIAGLSAAWALSDRAHVTLFEAGNYAGGHTHTVDVTLDGVTHGVDTGFLVFNERTYPLLIQLFEQLGVAVAKSDMSFSAQVARDGIEWSGSSLSTVFAQRRNLLRPAFWGMLSDLLRFNRLCTALAARGEEAALSEPIGAFLERHRFGRAFREWYLLPMVACIWSCPTAQMLQFPIRTLIRFCHNHGLLQVNERPQWWTVAGGARHYVQALLPAIHDVRLDTPVQAVFRPAAGGEVVLQSKRGREHFDAVILAGHSDQSLALLDEPSAAEHALLGAIRYQPNVAVLHTDAGLLPRRRAAWAAWNYESGSDASAVCLHYLLNQLQPLPWQQPVVVSLNPLRQPDPARVIGRYDYAHPVFDDAAVRAQARLPEIQGVGGVWYAGAWTRYGFHEDGLLSGLTAAQQLIARVLS
ncbi:MAG: FAD-dependent oxidoreductase [Burkholderiales bacterium]|nr:FAD-dependent oxidoreductase [Burkholderiales bacterium]